MVVKFRLKAGPKSVSRGRNKWLCDRTYTTKDQDLIDWVQTSSLFLVEVQAPASEPDITIEDLAEQPKTVKEVKPKKKRGRPPKAAKRVQP